MLSATPLWLDGKGAGWVVVGEVVAVTCFSTVVTWPCVVTVCTCVTTVGGLELSSRVRRYASSPPATAPAASNPSRSGHAPDHDLGGGSGRVTAVGATAASGRVCPAASAYAARSAVTKS